MPIHRLRTIDLLMFNPFSLSYHRLSSTDPSFTLCDDGIACQPGPFCPFLVLSHESDSFLF